MTGGISLMVDFASPSIEEGRFHFLIANKFWIRFAKPSKDPKPDNIAK